MNEFSAKWSEITPLGFEAGRFRVFPDHPLDFLLGFSAAGRREVIVEATAEGLVLPAMPIFRNVELSVVATPGHARIVLTLLDEDLAKSFAVMCHDLAQRAGDVSAVHAALSLFLSALGNWSDLLRRRAGDGMSANEALGLLGELAVLDALLETVGMSADAIVSGWRGPHGDARDIGLNGTRLEVKTQRSTGPVRLKISSLDQLDDRGQHVYIALNRMSPSMSGLSLDGLAHQIANRLAPFPHASAEFERKLELSGWQTGAPFGSDRFDLDDRLIFRVTEGFPRLTMGNVPVGVTSARYDLAGPVLDQFRTGWSEMIGSIRG